jgi:DNA-binding NarL/FixJ family response regulator
MRPPGFFSAPRLPPRLRSYTYLLKDRVRDVDSFVEAIRRVADGGSVLDPQVVTQMVGRKRSAGPPDDLTERERVVLELMAEGRSNQGIANALTVSSAAVENT